MVSGFDIVNPDVSYVRINQRTSPGTGESVRMNITTSLSTTDPAVVNAALLHPSMVTPPTEPLHPTVPDWRPRHQNGPHENIGRGQAVEVWRELTVARTSPPPRNKNPRVLNSTIVATQRSRAETNTDGLTKDQEIESLRSKLKVAEERMVKMTRVLKDPAKLKLLVENLRKLREGKERRNINVGKRQYPS